MVNRYIGGEYRDIGHIMSLATCPTGSVVQGTTKTGIVVRVTGGTGPFTLYWLVDGIEKTPQNLSWDAVNNQFIFDWTYNETGSPSGISHAYSSYVTDSCTTGILTSPTQLCNVNITITTGGQLASITIPTTASVQIGGTTTISAICKDSSGSIIACPPLTWSSGNDLVATVSNGIITGVSAGTTSINCLDPVTGITSNSCNVTVTTVAPKWKCTDPATNTCGSGTDSTYTYDTEALCKAAANCQPGGGGGIGGWLDGTTCVGTTCVKNKYIAAGGGFILLLLVLK